MKNIRIQLFESKVFRGLFGLLCILLALTILIMALIDINVKPIALSVAEARVRAAATDAINNAIRSCVQDVDYGDLIHVTHDERGRVSMLQANSTRMNQLVVETTLAAQQHIAKIEPRIISIPLGSAFGGPLLSGRGPLIPVRIVPAGSVTSSFYTNFSSAGINQTRHEIYLELHANMRITMPIGAKNIEVTVTVPITESVVVGDVPQTYVDTDNAQSVLPLIPEN